VRLRLRDLCGYRAGDKGDIANVALFAYDAEVYEVLRDRVTAEAVAAHFGWMVRGRVRRFEAPNVLALNFVMEQALGGGGPRSLRSDNLGKTLGGALVRMEIDVPAHVADRRRPRPDVSWTQRILGPLEPGAGAGPPRR
jgi:hypothetical protein